MNRFISLLCVLLIATMPIVSAQTLNVQQFSGKAGVRNVALMTDTLTVKTQVTVPNDDEITPNQVRLITSNGISYIFESCVQQAGGALCALTYELVGQGGEDTYTISLFDDDGNEIKTTTEELLNDFVDPAIQTFYADKEIIGQGSIKLSYRAEDYAFSPGDTTSCAGVGSIKIYENSVTAGAKATIPGTTQVNDCTIEGEYQYTPQSTGNVTLCAVAFDRIQKKSAPECITIYVDRTPPQVRSFRVVNDDDSTVYTIAPDGMTVNIEVSMNEPALDVNTVKADFSKIAGADYSERGPDDVGTPEHRLLIWNNIPLTKVTPCEFTLRAADELGNALTQKLICNIVSDTSPPAVIGMTTGFTSDDGTSLLGIQGDLQIRFNEKGMARSNAFIDTDGLGLGIKRADYCAPDMTDWVCHWRLPANVPAGRYSITVLTQTEDDLGNNLEAPSEYPLDYDPSPPVITGGPHIKAYHANADYGDKFVNSDTIEISYNVTGAVSAIANFDAIGGSNFSQGTCDGNVCTFSTTIQRSGGYTAKLFMKFIDTAGSYVEGTHQITVHEVLDEPNPNYWKTSVTCTPSIIDRSSSMLINHQVYCQIKLAPLNNSKQVDVVATNLGPFEECTGDLETSVASLTLINNGYLSRNPYFRVLLVTREYPEAQFNLTCPIHILTKVGDGFTSYPETENVTINIGFGDSDAGLMANNIDDKIEEAVDDAEDLNKWLDALVKFFEYAEMICSLRTILWDIAGALDALHGLWTVVSTATKGQPWGAAIEAGRDVYCKGPKEGYVSTMKSIDDAGLKMFCDFINCNAGTAISYEGTTTNQGTSGDPGTSSPGSVNVKESLIWSLATLCIPGIILNVDKYRQIQCQYAVCLKRDVKEYGVPLSVCDDEKAYLTCVYVWSQVFYALPYAAIVDSWLKTVQEWIANPAAAVAALIGALCGDICDTSNGIPNSLCSLAKVFEVVGRVIADYEAVKDENFFKVGQGPCNELKKILKDDE